MLKIKYIKPNENESPDEISIYNMKIADKYKHLQAFCQSSISWLKNDPDRNFQDLENLIRILELDTHLIAKPSKLEETENFVIALPNKINDTNKYEYVLLISCKPKEEAIKELLSYHDSYETNLSKLLATGTLTVANKQIKIDEIAGVEKSSLDNSNEKLIEKCELKYDFELVSDIELLNIIIEQIKNEKGVEPKKMLCGKFGDNNVYSLAIDGQIVSPIGWIEYSIDKIELIDFRKIKKI